jgi:6-phosphogluconolactonase
VPRFAFAVNSFNNTISQYVVDGEAGRLIPNGLASIGQFPAAIAVHPSNKYVFAIAQPAAQLHVYFLDNATGRLHETDNSPVDTGVVSPFSLALGQNGRYVYVAGRLSDNVMGFEFNEQTAELTPIKSMPVATGGRRARQIVVSPDGRFLYSVNVYSDTVSAFTIEQKSGALIPVKGSPVSVGKAPVDVMVDMADIPEDITQAPYNLHMHPSGKFLFVCNWMSASVSVFKVDQASGALTLVEGSPFISDPHPYDLIVSPDGRYLYTAHWAMNSIVSFKIAPDSGKLIRLKPERLETLGEGPVDLRFDQSHNMLYVSHYLSHNIAGYRYDANTGSLHLTDSTPSRFGPRAMDFSYGEAAVRYSSDYLFGISATKKSLFAYKISGNSGELQRVASIPLSAVPMAVAYDKVNRLVYVATNNPNQIQVFSLQNGKSFETQTPTPVTVKETPSDIAVGPNGLISYITSAENDRMLVYERHPVTGEIKEWPESPRTTDSYPTEVKIDPVGRFAFVLNEKSNTISSYRFRTGLWPLIDQIAMTTQFGNKNTQLTNMTTDPLGNFLFTTDGNNNEILVYWINTTSGVFDAAKESHFKVGARPVDMVFHPKGKRAYVVNNKDATIETYSINHIFGKLEKKLQTLKTAKSPRNLQLDASGRFAYLFYQDSNKISIYTVDSTSGQLTHQQDLHNDGVIEDAVIDITMH